MEVKPALTHAAAIERRTNLEDYAMTMTSETPTARESEPFGMAVRAQVPSMDMSTRSVNRSMLAVILTLHIITLAAVAAMIKFL